MPSPTAPRRSLTPCLGLDDHLWLDQPAPVHPPRGVVPRLPDAIATSSISLGSRRLCNESPLPAAPTADPVADHFRSNDPPLASIEFRRVTLYNTPRGNSRPGLGPRHTDSNLTRGRFNGYMSPATVRAVRRIVSTWTRSIWIYRRELKRRYDPGRAYPVFFTLTLSSDQLHTDAEINRKCLQPFLIRLRRAHGIEHYFWRAESQSNGRVHFHILCDRYIRHEDLRFAWNQAQNNLGYIDRYFEASGSADPPSTEIHRVRERLRDPKSGRWRTVDPIDYLLDYLLDVARPEPLPAGQVPDPKARPVLFGRYRAPDGTVHTYVTRPISGRVWGMSDGLRSIREPRAEADIRLIHVLERGRLAGTLRRVDTDHATLYFGDIAGVLSRHHPQLLRWLKRYYMHVFAWLYPGQLPIHYLTARPPLSPVNLWLDLSSLSFLHRKVYTTDSPGFPSFQALASWTRENRPEHFTPPVFLLTTSPSRHPESP